MTSLTVMPGLLTDPLKEARADVTAALEELQILLREPSRDGCWMDRWHESHERWVASHARWLAHPWRRN